MPTIAALRVRTIVRFTLGVPSPRTPSRCSPSASAPGQALGVADDRGGHVIERAADRAGKGQLLRLQQALQLRDRAGAEIGAGLKADRVPRRSRPPPGSYRGPLQRCGRLRPPGWPRRSGRARRSAPRSARRLSCRRAQTRATARNCPTRPRDRGATRGAGQGPRLRRRRSLRARLRGRAASTPSGSTPAGRRPGALRCQAAAFAVCQPV